MTDLQQPERHVIVQEGPDGAGPEKVIIAPGGLTWPDRRTPVIVAFDHTRPVGYATDLRREEDGKITAVIHIRDGKTFDEALALPESHEGRVEPRIAFMSPLRGTVETSDDGFRVVQEATLLDIALLLLDEDGRSMLA